MKLQKAEKRAKKQGTRAKHHGVSGKSNFLSQEISINKARKIKQEALREAQNDSSN